MDLNTGAEVHGLIERITAENLTNTFNALEARRLIDLVPVTPHRGGEVRVQKKNGEASGYVPGIGMVTVQDDRVSNVKYNEQKIERAGGYKLRHTPGDLFIEHLWADTVEDVTGYVCRLQYRASDRRPEALSVISQNRPIEVPYSVSFSPLKVDWVTVSFSTYKPWKKPDFTGYDLINPQQG